MPTPATYYMDNVFGQCQPIRKEPPSFSFGVKRHMPKKGMFNVQLCICTQPLIILYQLYSDWQCLPLPCQHGL